ncbi:hypothetical protein V5O48_012314 [Marasmius crinis-equi]|uniref:Cytochrome P450 n=1 Tax=Marasmius crinis-equi TaxID=585013 RepID=A0ABR3F359_9AGAR
MPILIVIASVALAATILYFLWGKRPAKLPYPPGPPPRLITGNLYDVPKSKAWKTYHEWSKTYGSGLVHYQVNSQHTVIINTKELSDRMLEKRSRIYSDRPYIPMVDLLGWAHINAGNIVKYRVTAHTEPRMRMRVSWRTPTPGASTDEASRTYNAIQSSKNSEFISNLREDPANFLAHIRTRSTLPSGGLAAAVILATLYGYDISPTDDYFVDLAEKAVGTLVLLVTPAAAMVNLFPILRRLPPWLPIFEFQKSVAISRELVNQMIEVPYEYVRSSMRAGTAKPSLLSKFLKQNDANGGDKDQESIIKAVSATGYGAGADTTVSVMETFFLAMGMHPDVQKKAQEGLDTVFGRGETPGYEECRNLPYIEAVFRETLRWSPPLPAGVFRAAFTDDVVDGYYIPKGE